MKNLALVSLCAAFLAGLPTFASAQQDGAATAINEGVRREALKIDLRSKLADAQSAHKRGALVEASLLYTDCLEIVGKIGTGVESEHKQAVEGNTAVRLILADQAHRDEEYAAADDQYAAILRFDSKNEKVIELRRINDVRRAANEGRRPSDKAIAALPYFYTNRVEAATLVMDGKLYLVDSTRNRVLRFDPKPTK